MLRVIINPVAGNGKSLALLEPVEAELRSRSIAYRVSHSLRPGQASILARDCAEGGVDGIVIIGGDGTLSEVVCGLGDAMIPLLIVPCGTGNDFIKVLKLPRDPLRAFRAQLDSPLRRLDLGLVNGRRFVNVSGTGFDIEVLRQTLRYKTRFTGLIAYLFGLISALRSFKPIDARITVDGVSSSERLTIVELANEQYIGGGMRVAPDADPGDGYFDLIRVRAVKKWQVIFLLPLFIPGWFVRLPITSRVRAKEVVIEAENMTLNVDGELIAAKEARYRILPGALGGYCPALKVSKPSGQRPAAGVQAP